MKNRGSADENGMRPRPYQVEIVDLAKKQNSIVCLGTGTGKTFISVLIIKEKQSAIYGTLATGGKRTFFLVTTVPLVYQQAEVISSQTNLKVGTYTGDMAVDLWDLEKWEKEFNEHDVLVMTAQILHDRLLHGFFGIHNINLLVLDECHNAMKNHVYVRIMRFYSESQSDQRPHVLGLTASIINKKLGDSDPLKIKLSLDKDIQHLEATLQSVCLTCSDQEATVLFAPKPSEYVFVYPDISPSLVRYPQVHRFVCVMEKTLNEAFTFLDEALRKVKDSQKKLAPTISWELRRSEQELSVAVDVIRLCAYILEQLGPYCLNDASCLLKKEIEKHKSKLFRSTFCLDYCVTILNLIGSLFMEVAKATFESIENIKPEEPFITAKASSLINDLLMAEKQNFKEQFNTDLCAILFTERKCTAVILSRLINVTCLKDQERFVGIWSNYICGHDADAKVSLVDSFMKSQDQQRILTQFRRCEFNILVSTSVVEEGLDVIKCNLVVRFDGLHNYREYAQSKGRARAKNSKFVVLAAPQTEDETKTQLQIMQTVEDQLFRKCQARVLPSREQIDAALLDKTENLVPSYIPNSGATSARITKDSCISLLYRYCQSLPCDRFSSVLPIFFDPDIKSKDCDCTETGAGDLQNMDASTRDVRCAVELPLNFPTEKKRYESGWFADRNLAKQSLCMEICQILHSLGELNDYLLPCSRDDGEDGESSDDNGTQASGEPKVGTRKRRRIYSRKLPKCLLYDGDFSKMSLDLLAVSIALTSPYENEVGEFSEELWSPGKRRGFGIFLPSGVPEIPEFHIYTRAGKHETTLTAIQRNIGFLSPENLAALLTFHRHVVEEYALKYTAGNLVCDPNSANTLKVLFVPLSLATMEVIDGLGVSHEGSEVFFKNWTMSAILDSDILKKCSSWKGSNRSALDMENVQKNFSNSVVSRPYLGDKRSRPKFFITGISKTLTAGSPMEGSKTFAQYYRDKYGVDVDPHQPLLSFFPASSRASFVAGTLQKTKSCSSPGRKDYLLPELCPLELLPSDLHVQAVLLPFVLYRVEYLLLATDLHAKITQSFEKSVSLCLGQSAQQRKDQVYRTRVAENDLEHVLTLERGSATQYCFPSVSAVLEAITTRQAHAGYDLERLEMLGDSFLKLSVTIFLFVSFPQINEGRLTAKRKKTISNKNLSQIAQRTGLHEIICNSEFGARSVGEHEKSHSIWIPPLYVPQDAVASAQHPRQEVQDKCLADAVEALIGAFFQTGGVNLALEFMENWLGIEALFRRIPETSALRVELGTRSLYADYPCPKSSARTGTTAEDLQNLYFKLTPPNSQQGIEKDLGYTFSNKSHLIQAMTHLSYSYNTLTGCYQEFEFLGDSVLDFLITLHIFYTKRSLAPGQLTSLRSALVNNNIFGLLAVKYGFNKSLQHLSPSLQQAIASFIKVISDFDSDKLFENPFVIVPPNSCDGFEAPKVLGDLFESVAGAIFIDSNFDLLKVWQVYRPVMQPVIDRYIENIPLNPTRALKEAFSDAKFEIKVSDSRVMCIAAFKRGGEDFSVRGIGDNKKIAKATASKLALDMLR